MTKAYQACEGVSAFVGFDGVTDVAPGVFNAAFQRPPHPVLDLGEGLFDPVEVEDARRRHPP
ncbi:MAG TPA: hypothetical protein VIF88_12990 [Methylocystis sp.]